LLNEVGQSDREKHDLEKGPSLRALFLLSGANKGVNAPARFSRLTATGPRAKALSAYPGTSMEYPMTRQTTAFALALFLGMMSATSSLAQDSTAPAPATPEAAPATDAPAQAAGDLPLGTPATPAPDGPGTTYVAARFDDWEQRCLRTADGSDPCELFQPLNDSAGNSVAQISIVSLPAGRSAAAGASVMVPLRTLLLEPLLMAIDGAPPKQYEYTVCAQVGCVAQFGLTAEELAAMKAGAKARLTITPFDAPDQKVVLDVSLKGFTAGFAAVNAANAP